MLRSIALYGTIAGMIVGVPMVVAMVTLKNGPPHSYIIGYTVMLVALSVVFVAIKRRRDIDLGGVIGFWAAFGLGLGISFVAGLFYVAAWELSLGLTHMDFMGGYTRMLMAQEKAKGASAAQLAKLAADMERLRIQYANPLYRLPETFTEIFPVGVLVSLVSAGLLSNRRFLPARRG